MALDVQRISLDISKQPTPQQVRLGQGDANATRLIIDVFDDGIAYSLTNYNVRLSMHLPNEGGYYQVNGTKSGNTATFDIDERYAATSYGFDGFGYVDILNGDTVICSTSRFQLVVLRNAADGVELSEQYINAVEDAVNRANEAAEAAEGIILQDVPTMSATIKGGAKLGDGLTVEDDTLSVDASTVASGVLPVDRGGTGVATAAAERNRLGLGNTTGALPIANGGTGASTADGALSNLITDIAAFRDMIKAMANTSSTNSGADLNDMAIGECWWGNNLTNSPDGTTAYFMAFRIGSLQVAYKFLTNGGEIHVWARCYMNSTWGEWTKLDSRLVSNTTISGIITASSGISIESAVYAARGGVATVRITFKRTGETSTGSFNIGTIADNKKPAVFVYGNTSSATLTYAGMTEGGTVQCYANSTTSTTSTYGFSLTYVLA